MSNAPDWSIIERWMQNPKPEDFTFIARTLSGFVKGYVRKTIGNKHALMLSLDSLSLLEKTFRTLDSDETTLSNGEVGQIMDAVKIATIKDAKRNKERKPGYLAAQFAAMENIPSHPSVSIVFESNIMMQSMVVDIPRPSWIRNTPPSARNRNFIQALFLIFLVQHLSSELRLEWEEEEIDLFEHASVVAKGNRVTSIDFGKRDEEGRSRMDVFIDSVLAHSQTRVDVYVQALAHFYAVFGKKTESKTGVPAFAAVSLHGSVLSGTIARMFGKSTNPESFDDFSSFCGKKLLAAQHFWTWVGMAVGPFMFPFVPPSSSPPLSSLPSLNQTF